MDIDTVKIGEHVLAKDGKPLGRITKFVVDPASARLTTVVVSRGPLSTERLVDLDLVDRAIADEIVLTVGEEEARHLPTYLKREVTRVREPLVSAHTSVAFETAPGFVWDPYEGEGVVESRGDVLLDAVAGGIVETTSSVSESAVVLSRQTAIITADGFKAGRLHALDLDDERRIAGIFTTSGFVYKSHVRVPITTIASVTHQRIVLTKGLDDAMDAVNEVDIHPA